MWLLIKISYELHFFNEFLWLGYLAAFSASTVVIIMLCIEKVGNQDPCLFPNMQRGILLIPPSCSPQSCACCNPGICPAYPLLLDSPFVLCRLMSWMTFAVLRPVSPLPSVVLKNLFAAWCPACPQLLDVPPVLNSLTFHLSSASWYPACPHLLDVPPVLSFLLSRLSSASWCPACPLLLDVPSVCCCLMSRLSSGAQCIFKPFLLCIDVPCILVSV